MTERSPVSPDQAATSRAVAGPNAPRYRVTRPANVCGPGGSAAAAGPSQCSAEVCSDCPARPQTARGGTWTSGTCARTAALAQAVRACVPLVQVPPRAVWGRAGQSLHTSAEQWLGPAVSADPAHPEQETLAGLVTRYLGAFGPATARDVAAWSGLTGLRAVMELSLIHI